MRKSKLFEVKQGEITAKDMSTLREADDTHTQRERTRYPIRDYSMQHTIVVERELNQEADNDTIFRLRVDEQEMLIDAEQLIRAIRWV